MRFLTTEEVLFIHDLAIQESGGSHGIRDLGLLESALAALLQTFGGEDLYPTLWLKAGALLRSLIQNHPFIDGNKRTALTATGAFLELNKRKLIAAQQETVEFIVQVAEKKISVEAIAAWLQHHAD